MKDTVKTKSMRLKVDLKAKQQTRDLLRESREDPTPLTLTPPTPPSPYPVPSNQHPSSIIDPPIKVCRKKPGSKFTSTQEDLN